MAMEDGGVRVYVGGLPGDAASAELQERFSRALAAADCRVARVELPPPKGLLAPAPRGFAYLTLTGGGAAVGAELLARTFNRTKWRGAVLRVEPARPDFMAQLRTEWAAQRAAEAAAAATRAAATTPSPASAEAVAALRVGGVAFSGSRRTSFEYADVDWEAAFAAKQQQKQQQAAAIAKAQAAMAAAMAQEAESGDAAQDEEAENESSDDADYWATSGDEEAAEEEEEEEAADLQPPVAVDDVEAFVRQVMALEPEEQQQQEEEESSSSSDDDDTSDASSSSDDDIAELPAAVEAAAAQVDEGDVEAFVQQVERAEANTRRVAALEARMKQKQQAQAAAKIDLSAKSGTKITFDDSGNEQEEDGGDEGGGAAITNWLDSSDDDDDADAADFSELRDGSDDEAQVAKQRRRHAFEFAEAEDEEAGKAFAVRPEFLGERGKKLFELQKRFGGDQRFRMDARFIEDEENEYGGMDGLVDDVDSGDGDGVEAGSAQDGPAGELQQFLDEDGADAAAAHERAWLQEQDAALSAIAAIFPDMDIEAIKYRVRVKVKKDPIKEASWMGQMKRYDPRDAHARHAYELPVESEAARLKGQRGGDAAAAPDAKKTREEKEVLVGGDRFFATSTTLGSMFTRVRKNSEDGTEGEAALDGVFGFARGLDDGAAGGDASGGAAGAVDAATFKLSSLFDFPVEEEKGAKNAQLAEKLFEEDEAADDEDGGEKPWHFTQSFFNDEKDDTRMDTDNEDDEGEEGEDDEDAAANGEDEDGDGKSRKRKKALKKSLAEFLAFGRTFVSPQDGSTNPKAKEWTEKRKRLTLDFKRKRKDALRSKKKLQQRLQKQHKKQKTGAPR